MYDAMIEIAKHSDWPLVIGTLWLCHKTQVLANADQHAASAITGLASAVRYIGRKLGLTSKDGADV